MKNLLFSVLLLLSVPVYAHDAVSVKIYFVNKTKPVVFKFESIKSATDWIKFNAKAMEHNPKVEAILIDKL